MTAPLSLGFNCAVLTMANKVCPCGYDVGENAPSSLAALQDHIADTGRILVWNGASDHTIFGSPEVNWAFRAWHDWTHWVLGAAFTLDGELAVAHRQIQDLCRIYGHNPTTRGYARLIMAEVYGQALHYRATGSYPVDQVSFAREFAL